MASSVALVNKDIARHYQLANLLTPPEAIELTKLYNEMSDILSKPVKFRNKPTQLHLFYDLLSQYAKHFENVKLDGAPVKLPPKPEDDEKQPHQTTPQTTPRRAEPEATIDDIADFVDAADGADGDQTMLTRTSYSSINSKTIISNNPIRSSSKINQFSIPSASCSIRQTT